MGTVSEFDAAAGKTPRPVRADDVVAEVLRLVAGSSVADLYHDRVMAQRTRRFDLGTGASVRSVEILHTLLGIELKVGRKRLLCPDLATARYLCVFARLGVGAVAVPYDITQVSRIADELESAWHRMQLLADHLSSGRSDRLKALVRSRLVAHLRGEVERLGAGSERPSFVQNTRQRRR